MRPHRSVGLGENCLEAQSEGHGHVLRPTNAGTLFEKARGVRIRSSMHTLSKHDSSSCEQELRKAKNPTTEVIASEVVPLMTKLLKVRRT